MTDQEINEKIAGLEQAEWRKLIRPLVLQMHADGLTHLEIEKRGAKVVLRLAVAEPGWSPSRTPDWFVEKEGL